MATLKTRHLGKILVDRNVISAEELQEALIAQRGTSLRLGQLLTKKGMATEEDILACLAEQYNISFEPRLDFDDPDQLFSAIPVQFMKNNKIMPFKKKGDTILVGIADVLNIQPLDDLKMLFPQYDFEAILTTE